MTDPVLAPLLLIGACAAVGLWVAWRLRVPTLLIVIPIGGVVGPLLGLVPTATLAFEGMRTLVVAVASIWLFDAGRQIRAAMRNETSLPVPVAPRSEVAEQSEVGERVEQQAIEQQATGHGPQYDALTRRMRYGVPLLHALLIAAAGYAAMQWPVSLALLAGGVLAVPSSYALGALLRHTPLPESMTMPLRVEAGAGGAILLGLLLVGITVAQVAHSPIAAPATTQAEHLALGIGLDVFTSLGIAGVAVALLLGVLRWVQRPSPVRGVAVALLVWASVFGADYLQHGPGLLVPLLTGGFLAYQPWVQPTHALRMPPALYHVTAAVVGVIIGTNLGANVWDLFSMPMLLFAAAALVARPVALGLLWWGSRRTWRSLLMLGSWHARDVFPLVTAAAVLPFVQHWYPSTGGTWLPALIFVAVAAGTYAALFGPALTRWLVDRASHPSTLLFIGAGYPVRRLASFLQQRGLPVQLVDDREDAVAAARAMDLPAARHNLEAPEAYDTLPLHRVERAVIMLPDTDRLHDAVAHASGSLPWADRVVMPVHEEEPSFRAAPAARTAPVSYQWMRTALESGAQFYAFRPADILPGEAEHASYEGSTLMQACETADATPLFVIHENGVLTGPLTQLPATMRAADRIVLLMQPPMQEDHERGI